MKPKMESRLFSSIVLGFFASCFVVVIMDWRFLLFMDVVTCVLPFCSSALSSPPSASLTGLREAKTKLLVFLAPAPDLAESLPLVRRASLSRAAELRLRKDPFLFPL